MQAKTGQSSQATTSPTQSGDIKKNNELPSIPSGAPGLYRVIRRDGSTTGFNQEKIAIAITKAFLALNVDKQMGIDRIHQAVAELAAYVVSTLIRRKPNGGTFHIEEIQDQVELSLMRKGYLDIARAYMLYREERAKKRAAVKSKHPSFPGSEVTQATSNPALLNIKRLRAIVAKACTDLESIKSDVIVEL